MRNLLLLLTLLTLAGCVAVGGDKFSQDAYISPDRSVVYIYREMALQSIGECYPIYVDHTKLGCIKAGGYLRYEVQPGTYLISERNPIDNDRFIGAYDTQLKGGKSHYYRVTPFGGFKEVSESEALPEIVNTSEQATLLAEGL